MNIKRKLFAILLSAAMLFTFMPFAVFADESAPDAGPMPISVEWSTTILHGYVGTTRLQEYSDQSSFTVRYRDDSGVESTKVFKYIDPDDTDAGIFIDDSLDATDASVMEDPLAYIGVFHMEEEQAPFKLGNNTAKLSVEVPYIASGAGTNNVVINRVAFTVDVDVFCFYDNKPIKVEFVPAAGFTPTCRIGGDYLTEEIFYGEGNKFVVTYEGYSGTGDVYDTYPWEYIYAKGKNYDGETVEGFFRKGKVNESQFTLDEGRDVNLGKGTHEVDFSYSEYVSELDEVFTVPFKVKVKADKFDAYTNYPVYSYTGKVIQPKFKVYDSENNIIPAKEYTVSKAKAKKLGWYTVTIKFKDTSKYPASITGYYGIGPKKPVLTKVNAGKKKLLVKWKRYKTSELKKIDGMVIQLSTDKHFLNGVKTVKVSKKEIKKGKKLVKGLKKGKKYYVRAYVYKSIKQDGVKFKMESAESKVLSKKTK